MLGDAQLREVLARLDPGPPISSLWIRAIAAEHLVGPPPGEQGGPQPLWAGGAPRSGARYTRKGGARMLYLAESFDTAMHETGAVVTVGGRQMLTGAGPMTSLQVMANVRDVLDLHDGAVRDALGTRLQELTGSWRLDPDPPTQRLGECVAACDRFDALLAPSARASVGRILVVFAERLHAGRGTYCAVSEGGRLSHRIP